MNDDFRPLVFLLGSVITALCVLLGIYTVSFILEVITLWK